MALVQSTGALWITALTLLAEPAPTQTFDLGGGHSLEVRRVHAGTFQQGSPVSEAERSDEESLRTVTLTQDYYLGTTEVTVGQFRQFVSASNFRTEAEVGTSGGFGWDGIKLTQRKDFNWRNPGFPQTDAHPVTGVTYDDALAFCAWLRQRTSQPFDLPTEAQWEYAARAGQNLPWPGSAAADAVAWHKGNSGNQTHPVGQLMANAWGFRDLGGNVAEWCRDWHGPYAVGGATGVTDPWVSTPPGGDKPRRVLRGGSWMRNPKHARVAARYRNEPKSRNADNGFRVFLPISAASAQTPPTPTSAPAAAAVPAASSPVPVQRAPIAAAEPPVSHRVPPPGQLPTPVDRISWMGGLLGMLCPLGAVGLLGGLAYAVIRKLRSSSTTRPPVAFAATPSPQASSWIPSRILPPETVHTEIRSDGFMMRLAGVAAGELVRYSVDVGGRTMTETVSYEPGPLGQFIYTGGRPDAVIIRGIAAGSDSSLPGQTILEDAGPGGHMAASAWTRPGIGNRSTSDTRFSERRSRRPGAYE